MGLLQAADGGCGAALGVAVLPHRHEDFAYATQGGARVSTLLVKPTGLDAGDMRPVQSVVAHQGEVTQVEDAGVAEISIRGAGNDSLVFSHVSPSSRLPDGLAPALFDYCS